ncbi:hypothetical protein [Actinomadura fibrosa]|uniref:Uncharacterized protein n=1 Tax=Actinomadura fibrosa TaxID=111802 RepID=A0ABW2XZP9_9ACTN|nr:hypothetical protein [Actinomadura fibrosa]
MEDAEREHRPQPNEHPKPMPSTPRPRVSLPSNRPTIPDSRVRVVDDDHPEGPSAWIGIALALVAVVAAAYKWRRLLCAAVTASSMSARLGARTSSSTSDLALASSHVAPPPVRPKLAMDLFVLKNLSLAGPGAEDAVRHIAIELLTKRSGSTAEVVLTRADAWRLLQLDNEALCSEQIPGLILTENARHTQSYLAIPVTSQRLLIMSGTEPTVTYTGSAAVETAVLSLEDLKSSAVISATGEVSKWPQQKPGEVVPESLSLLSRSDAFERLTVLPLCSRQTRESLDG